MTTHLPILQTEIACDSIDLGLGDPSLSLLPLDLIRQSALDRLGKDDPSFLQYGFEQGNSYFRLALADFLTNGYGFLVESSSLFVTAGASQALDLICTLFTRPGDIIFVEEPSYFLALRIFADHDLKVVPIQTDASGLVIEDLEEKLASFHPKFLYLIPTYQNPSGCTLSQERREQLVGICQEQGFLVVADEGYHLLNYGTKPPKAFAAYTRTGNIISLGSFSKILAPGLRLGWIQAANEKIKILTTCGLLDSGGGIESFYLGRCMQSIGKRWSAFQY